MWHALIFFMLLLQQRCLFVFTQQVLLQNNFSEWREDFVNGFKYWTSDEGDVWRETVLSDTIDLNMDYEPSNSITLELNNEFSQALYFRTMIMNHEIDNSQLTIYITILGCNSLVELYWKGRNILRGPKECPDNMWIPLEFNSYLTEFDEVDLLLLVTGPIKKSVQPLLLISQLDVLINYKVIPPSLQPTEPSLLDFDLINEDDDTRQQTDEDQTSDDQQHSTKLWVGLAVLIVLFLLLASGVVMYKHRHLNNEANSVVFATQIC